jgi:hypothetical protein
LEIFIVIATFCIVSTCIIYAVGVVLANILAKDMKANGKLLDRKSRQEILDLFLLPVFNIFMIIGFAYMVYSYHRYTLGKTDYNIFDEEGEM